ncbi:unnamed protein product [Peniophora sp. CBMAI 1063]|nr:unnamed protein product [Peniophora sp. CBMAI 1063]
MADALAAAREHNTLAPIHVHLANEHLQEIFLALSLIDAPSLERPQGWYLQVNGICHIWREIALNFRGLWARNAGSFPSRRMTDLAIERAGAHHLSFVGHFKDHDGPGYVLSDYQLSLVETRTEKLRSLVHELYTDWAELFYRVQTLPELVTARICDDSGPDMWKGAIGAPQLECLYLNNGLIPFNAPRLRYLHIDMDNFNWREGPRSRRSDDEPMSDSCEAIPRVFPTREVIALLQRSPGLERLIITNMPELQDTNIPSVHDLHAELPNLRGLHLGGNSEATGDLWQRLRHVPSDVQVFIDTVHSFRVLYGGNASILDAMHDFLNSPAYDSVRLSMDGSHDLLFQLWSSKERGSAALELPASLRLTESTPGAALTIRYHVWLYAPLFEDFIEEEKRQLTREWARNEDPYERYRSRVAKEFYNCMATILNKFDASAITNVDLTDIPFGDQQFYPFVVLTSAYEKPDKAIVRLFRSPDVPSSPQISLTLNWDFLRNLQSNSRSNAPDRLLGFYIPNSVRELTIVNFPCASFPHWKRYDDEHNEKAWNALRNVCSKSFQHRLEEGVPPLVLKLAESSSEMSNMERSEEPKYKHMTHDSYEDAVRAVTDKGYRQIASFVAEFADLRIHRV